MLEPPVQTVQVSLDGATALRSLSRRTGLGDQGVLAKWCLCYSLVLPEIPGPRWAESRWTPADFSELSWTWDQFGGGIHNLLTMIFRHWVKRHGFPLRTGMMAELFQAHLERGIQAIALSPLINSRESFVTQVFGRIDAKLSEFSHAMAQDTDTYHALLREGAAIVPGMDEWIAAVLSAIDPDAQFTAHHDQITNALIDLRLRTELAMKPVISKQTQTMMEAMLLMDANPSVLAAVLSLSDDIHEKHLQYLSAPLIVGRREGDPSAETQGPAWDWLRKAALVERLNKICEEANRGEVGNLATVAEVACYLFVAYNSDMVFQIKDEYMDLWLWVNGQTMLNHPDLSPSKLTAIDEYWSWWNTSLKGSGVDEGQKRIEYKDIEPLFVQLAADIRNSAVKAAEAEGVGRRERKAAKPVKADKTKSLEDSQAETLELSDELLLEMFALPKHQMDPNVVLMSPQGDDRRIALPPIRLNKGREEQFNPTAGAGSLKGKKTEEPVLTPRKLKPKRTLGFGGDRTRLADKPDSRYRLRQSQETEPKQLPPADE